MDLLSQNRDRIIKSKKERAKIIITTNTETKEGVMATTGTNLIINSINIKVNTKVTTTRIRNQITTHKYIVITLNTKDMISNMVTTKTSNQIRGSTLMNKSTSIK